VGAIEDTVLLLSSMVSVWAQRVGWTMMKKALQQEREA
jgi:hypothetical protein